MKYIIYLSVNIKGIVREGSTCLRWVFNRYPLLAIDTEVSNCFSIYYNSEQQSGKMMIFNSFIAATY